MPFRIVQSKQNGRLKQLRRALAHPVRGDGEMAGIEGPNLLKEAVRAGLRVECVFAAQGAEDQLEGLELPQETDVLVLPKELLTAALATETPQPVAALIATPQWTWEDIFDSSRGRATLTVVLAGLQDAGNVGAILRSAEAFGATGAVSLPGTVSAWNPKAVRASAGSIFRLPVIAAETEECFARLRAAGVKSWTTAADGATALGNVDLKGNAALVIGNEGNGVGAEVAALTEGALTIPCPGPVESLNAAVAASVLLYEASRQRAHGRQKGGRQ